MSSLRLSKIIPERRKVVYFRWCVEYMKMSQEFREVRATCATPMDTCYWCSHKFIDGEMMMIAQPVKGGNKVLCKVCALNTEEM